MKSRYSLSQLFHDLHLWLGLGTGLIAFLLCLSGTLLVLQNPVEQWVNREVLTVTPQGSPQALETLIPKIQAETGSTFSSITLPAEANGALQLQEGRKTTYVNPYTGTVLGQIHAPTRDFFMFWFRLHRWLLFDTSIGRPITGAATVMFIVICVTGLWLWLKQAQKQMRRSLLLKRNVSWKRLNFDLHVVLGFYALIPLVVMAISGLFWSYREPFVATTHLLLNGKPAPVQEKEPEGDKNAKPITALPYAQLLQQVHQRYPYTGIVQIRFPVKPEQPVSLTKTNQSHFWSIPSRDQLSLNAKTGQVVKEKPFASLSRAEKVLGLIKAIHIGTIFSGVSLWIYGLAAAIGTSLPITGTLYWWNRTRKKSRPDPIPRRSESQTLVS
jgi:uncharacterized iron-regulated membrane protein